jgi:hypothetical protein
MLNGGPYFGSAAEVTLCKINHLAEELVNGPI